MSSNPQKLESVERILKGYREREPIYIILVKIGNGVYERKIFYNLDDLFTFKLRQIRYQPHELMD